MDSLKSYFKKKSQIIQKAIPFSFMNGSKTYSYIHKTIKNYKDDITNLKKLSLAIEENPCIILITDKHGVIEYVNSSFTRITGYSKEEAIGKTPAILESGLQSAEFYRDMWDTILKGEIWQGEILNKTKQGDLQWQFVRIAPIKDIEGNIVNYVGIQEDISKHKHNELQLRILQQAVDKSPVSIIITDKYGSISYINPHFTKITGYTYKEAIGNNPKILKGGKNSADCYQNLWKTISSGEVWQGELCNIKKNGEEFWEQVVITPIFNNNNGVQFNLKKSDGDKEPSDYENGDINHQESVNHQGNINHQDSSANDHKSANQNSGKIEHYVAVKLDITDARRAEQAIRDSEYRFKSIIASMEQGFWMVDKKWRTIEVNAAACEMVGISEKELIGRSIYDFFDDEHKQKIKTHIRHWSPSSRSSFEVLLLRPDGGRVHCLISHTPIFDQKHRRIGVFAVITDFTKRKEMEKQLIEAKERADEARQKADEARERAENASRVKSDFLANMSHEIRTPMNAILGFLELALEDELSLNQKNKISIAHSSANALLSLLNDILDFSKVEQKRLTTEIRAFDLRELIKTRLDLLAIKAIQKGLELKCEIAPELSEKYLGDPLRIGQVIVNIVGNAIKFTNQGRVEIKVEKYTSEKENVETSSNFVDNSYKNGVEKNNNRENIILFSIHDTGIGIPEQHKRDVFEPFTQADASTTRRFGGTGLGTSISKHLVELMGGKIWFESKEGEGTVFYFTIKMVQATEIKEAINDKSMTTQETFSGLNILIADDLEENVLLTKLFLQKLSHKVTGVNNGIDAISEFKRGIFDVILMDVHMPEMDGIEATIKIRELEKETGNQIPIIAVTASVMNEERELYESVGMNAFISKPINFKELDGLIKKVVIHTNKTNGSLLGQNKIHDNNGILEENLSNEVDSAYEDDLISKTNDHFMNLEFPPEITSGVDIKRAIDNWSTPSVFADVLSRFYNENKEVYRKIEALIIEENISEVRRITHALKGLSGNLSLPPLFAIFTAMDDAAIKNKIDIVKSFLLELKKELDKVPSYIEAMRNSSNLITQPETKAQNKIESGVRTKIETEEREGVAGNEVKSILSDLVAACEQYSPDEVYPFLERLQPLMNSSELKNLVDKVEQFDFDAAKDEAMVLLAKL
ncbi:MAG: PAS domain S-box protein [Desulfamplus sp.]|nr:PAS domain S-box protein [Desulfamplus sp.]